MGVELIPHS